MFYIKCAMHIVKRSIWNLDVTVLTLILHRSLSSQHERNVQPPIMYFAGLAIHEKKSSIEDVSQFVSVQVRITES
jgi:hypothetical protein